MKCPYCGYEESKVIDSRPTDEGARIRRRRECLKCSQRFTTYEVVETVPIVVIKKDKSRESFDRNKLLAGLLKACEKRPVPTEILEKIVDEIEIILHNSLEREVTSMRVGELAMERLKDVDQVAYVRFASVYRQFRDINTFMDELATLCGVTNAFADVDGWAEISEEQVLDRNPDFIVTNTMYYGEGPTPVEEIASRAGWEAVTAVQLGNIYNADSNAESRPGPRLVQAAEELYNFFYGETAAEDDAA